jgi:hypothetical protein
MSGREYHLLTELTATLIELRAEIRELKDRTNHMSNAVSAEIQTLGSLVTAQTTAINNLTAVVTSENAVIANAVNMIQGLSSTDSLTPEDQATLANALTAIATSNAALVTQTSAITNQGSLLANAQEPPVPVQQTGTVDNTGSIVSGGTVDNTGSITNAGTVVNTGSIANSGT